MRTSPLSSFFRWLFVVGFAGTALILVLIAVVSSQLRPSQHNFNTAYRGESYSDSTSLNKGSRNYAGKWKSPSEVEFIYEQKANLFATTNQYSESYQKVQSAVKDSDARIQSESTQGLDENRNTNWVIAVKPGEFDSLVKILRGVGEVKTFRKDLVDHTGDYRALLSERKIQQEYLESLESLRQKEGDIQQRMKLEDRLREERAKLSQLGVRMDDFVGDEQFSTIEFQLRETVTTEKVERGINKGILAIALLLAIGAVVLIFLPKLIQRTTQEK